jgi:hydrogenase expression/formation protein HypD
MSHPFRFADPRRARQLADAIRLLAPRDPVKLVHVCGTHEIAITRHGLRRLLPETVRVLEGPGCPVCVTPAPDIETAIRVAEKGATVCSFGDMLRVPGLGRSLDTARSEGCDVRTVLSIDEAVRIAGDSPRDVVFFAVGFETTTPMTAAVALERLPQNFSILTSHKTIPPAMAALLDLPGTDVDGYLAPGHVSTIIGTKGYEDSMGPRRIPVVVGGFEPLDILYAIALLLRQIRDGEAKIENGYPRAVNAEGNIAAQGLMEEVFEPTSAAWRGIGCLPKSGVRFRPRYAAVDARTRFDVGEILEQADDGACRCPDVLTARAIPSECPLFGRRCTPLTPVGPCMVGAEGACAIWFRYGGERCL